MQSITLATDTPRVDVAERASRSDAAPLLPVAASAPATTTSTTSTTTAAPVKPAPVRAAKVTATAPAKAETPAVNGSVKENVAAIARSQIGKAYRAGATGPGAFDCSGLVFYVFNQAGIGIPRLTSDGYYSKYSHIKRSELQPGDLVVSSGHIGIYVGGGQMVHASTPRGGVKQSPIDSAGRPFGFARI